MLLLDFSHHWYLSEVYIGFADVFMGFVLLSAFGGGLGDILSGFDEVCVGRGGVGWWSSPLWFTCPYFIPFSYMCSWLFMASFHCVALWLFMASFDCVALSVAARSRFVLSAACGSRTPRLERV